MHTGNSRQLFDMMMVVPPDYKQIKNATITLPAVVFPTAFVFCILHNYFKGKRTIFGEVTRAVAYLIS